MPALRWILVGCGAILLLGIYLWGRRGARKEVIAEEFDPRARPEPPLRAVPHVGGEDDEAALEASEDEVDAPPAAPAVDQFAITAMRAATYRGRIEPTLNDEHAETTELPVHDDEPMEEAASSGDAPTLGMSSTPAPRRIERRKIIALRLAAGGQRFDGGQLREILELEELRHGRYDVYHRLHADGSSIFSVASMVEPGTFDRDKMPALTYPGVTLFAQLPGPAPGAIALNELVACGRRLQEVLGGTLQDERGVPLTVHRIERLRQEIRDFEHGPAREIGPRGTSASAPAP